MSSPAVSEDVKAELAAIKDDDKEIRERFIRRYLVEDIADYWNKDVEAFRARSAKYYLYH